MINYDFHFLHFFEDELSSDYLIPISIYSIFWVCAVPISIKMVFGSTHTGLTFVIIPFWLHICYFSERTERVQRCLQMCNVQIFKHFLKCSVRKLSIIHKRTSPSSTESLSPFLSFVLFVLGLPIHPVRRNQFFNFSNLICLSNFIKMTTIMKLTRTQRRRKSREGVRALAQGRFD